jgi:hypothetical protein
MATKSVLEIFNTLEKNQAKVVYASNYSRITPQVVQTFGVFVPYKELTLTPMNFSITENKANVIVKNVVKGEVKLNPNTAKRVGLSNMVEDVKNFEDQAYVCDNKINIPTMDVVVSKRLANDMDFLENIREYSANEIRADITLTGRPIFDTTKNVSNESLYERKNELNVLKLKEKVVKALYNNCKFKTYPSIYNEEQKTVLRDHGINEKREYVGVGKQKVVSGSKKVRITTIDIDDLIKVPTITDFENQRAKGGKLNAYHLVLQDELNKQNQIIQLMDNSTKKIYLDAVTADLKFKIKKLVRNLTEDKNIALQTGTLFENTEKKNDTKYIAKLANGNLVIKDSITVEKI